MDARAGSIKYILIIVAILAVVFLGQQAFIRGFSQKVVSGTGDQIRTYISKGSDWATSAIIAPMNGGVETGKEIIINGIDQEKEKISESIGEKIKNYFSGVADAVMGKPNSPACPAPAATPEP